MKKILIILAFVASFFGASAQTWTPINGRQRFVSGLGIPVRDSSYYNQPTDTAFIFINYHDSLPYYKYKSWIRPLGGSGGGGTITLSGAVTGSGTSSIVTTLSNGVVGIANHSATGTPSSTTYLRGDNTWATITGGGMVYPGAGIALSTGSAWGTSITDNSANWNTAYTNRISSLTTTGSSGASTLVSNVLNIPTYTLAGLGGISLTSLSATSPIFYNNTTGVISSQAATTSLNGYLTSTDWTTFNGKQAAITLTTTGTSGAATFASNTLNIPNYTYTLPTATNTVLGGVKPDGTSILNTAGVISVTLASIGAQAAGSYQPLATNLTSIGALANGSGALINNGTGTFSYGTPWTGLGYLTANQSITLSGHVTGTGTTAITTSSASKFILQGTTDATTTAAQFLGALGTGILKNTTTTGVLSIAVAGDFPTLNQSTTGSAGSVANAATFNNSGTGAVSGTTYNGSAAQTISYNTLGASPLIGSSSFTTAGTITSGVWNAGAVTSSGAVTGTSIVKSGGTASQILMADGSIITAGSGITISAGTIQASGTAGVTTFSAGTTGFTPSTATSGAVTLAGTLIAGNGGTGQSTYAIGDLLSANTTTTLSKIADVAVGSYLRSGGVGTLPLWSTLILPNAATTGDVMIATGTNTVGSLADAATGNALISGGAGVAPSYGKIGLTTHVSGTLPIANGGTNSATALSGSSIMVSNGTNIVQGTAGTTTTLLHGNAAGTPTYSAVSLTADVTGLLPVANGGSGVGTLTGLVKGNGTSAFTAAVAGTDYQSPLTFSTGLTNTTGTVTVNTSQNISTLSNLTSNGLIKTSGGTGALSIAAAGTDYQAVINGTGFVKATGTTISYDNSTYLTTTTAGTTYVPYTSATGAVNLGTNTLASGAITSSGAFNGTSTAGNNLNVTSNSDWGLTVQNLGTTSANGLYVNIGASSTGVPFRVDKGGVSLFALANTGAATFSSTINSGAITSSGGITATSFIGNLNYTLTFGTHMTGTSFNNSGAVTIATDAATTATASTLVARDGSGYIYAVSFFESSDARLKNIIARNNDMVLFKWKPELKRDTKLHYGYIAQEVKKFMPDAVNKDDGGNLSVDYVQVHTLKINKLENEITELKKEIEELKKLIKK